MRERWTAKGETYFWYSPAVGECNPVSRGQQPRSVSGVIPNNSYWRRALSAAADCEFQIASRVLLGASEATRCRPLEVDGQEVDFKVDLALITI